MADDDKLILSLNQGPEFDIDFENAYQDNKTNDAYEYWHPCYLVNEETVER
jgi:hypothetical protein